MVNKNKKNILTPTLPTPRVSRAVPERQKPLAPSPQKVRQALNDLGDINRYYEDKKYHAFVPQEPAPEFVPIERPKLRKTVFVDDVTLPSYPAQTHVRLLARDPNWLIAYWDIAPQAMSRLKTQVGAGFDRSRFVIRMNDVTLVQFNGQNANTTFDVEIRPEVKNWYIDSWKDNVHYCAQLGLKTPDGDFHEIAQSNFIQTPRLGFSDRSETIWMNVKDNDQSLPYLLAHRVGKDWAKRSSRIKFYLTEDDIRAYYSRLFPLLRKRFASRLSKRRRKLVRFGKDEFFLDDLELLNMSRSKFLRRLLVGASEELVEQGEERGGASETVSSFVGASEQVLKRRKFFFELGTELIVYGRTEPDAEVRHGGKKVALKDDGTFSLRFALPDDGFIPLDFTAISADKIETQSITTSAKRALTHYARSLKDA